MKPILRSGADRTRRCRDLGPWISAYADGELESAEFTRERCQVETHLESCADCAAAFSLWAGDAALLVVEEAEVQADPWFTARFALRAREEQAVTERWRLRIGRAAWRLLPVAVTVLGLALGSLIRVELEERSLDHTLIDRLHDLEARTLAPGDLLAGAESASRSRSGGAEPALDFDRLLRSGEPGERAVEPADEGADGQVLRFDKDR